METYIDIQIVGKTGEGDYVAILPKEELARLVNFSEELVIRNWDGERPVPLERYGDDAVRSQEDASVENNLENLPTVKVVRTSD